MTAATKPRCVRVWALVDPFGLIVDVSLSQADARYKLATICSMRLERSPGWRVRRLTPEEVAP